MLQAGTLREVDLSNGVDFLGACSQIAGISTVLRMEQSAYRQDTTPVGMYTT